MPNGKPGDHPYTDIVHHRKDIYSVRAAGLVREIAKLGDESTRRDLGDMLMQDYNEFYNPDVAELERVLTDWRDRLLVEAKERGYEIDPDAT